MVQLQKDIEQIKSAGINLVGISYDSLDVLKKYADKESIGFPLLSDEGSKTIDAYGIRNKDMDGKKFGPNDLSGIPHPGTYLIDAEGVVRAKIFVGGYEERHSTEDLLAAAKKVE